MFKKPILLMFLMTLSFKSQGITNLDFLSLKTDHPLNSIFLSDDESVPGCEYVLQRSDAIMISRYYGQKTKTCYLSIRPFNPKNLTYRSYLFTNDGMLMVFNSYGPGSVQDTTGARTFYLFPRVMAFPKIEVLENGDVLVQTQSQHQFIFNSASFSLSEVSDAVVFEDANISKSNKGGVDLKLKRGLLLDLGFIMGQNPAEIPSRRVFFKDAKNQSCTIRNQEIFNYRDDDVYLDFSDQEIKTKFRKQCSKLSFGF